MRWLFWLVVLACLFSHALLGETVIDAQKAEAAARTAYIQRFYQFTQNKNVMGKASTPDGKQTGGGRKVRFDQDDGVAYESELTYHDLSFNIDEEVPGTGGGVDANGRPKPPETRKLFAFVSPHGKLTSAGGSSLLERTVYQFHEKYSQQDKKKDKAIADAIAAGNPPPPEKPGIEERSVYRVETREVIDKPNRPGNGGATGGGTGSAPPSPPQKDKVERVFLKEDVKKAIEDVGDRTFEDLQRSARDDDKQNNDRALPNLTFLYEAAGRAVKAMWGAAMANLIQRRTNRALPDGGYGKPELSEHLPTCDAWASANLQQQLTRARTPAEKQQIQKDLEAMNKQCQEVAALPADTINPTYEPDNSGKIKLKTGNLKTEDSIERDERAQLELLGSAGKKLSQVKSNWQYGPNEDKVERTRYDSGGNEVGKYTETMADQLQKYNQQVQDAVQGYDDVKKRFPDLKYDKQKMMGFQFQPETLSVMQIDHPTESQMDELGAKPENTAVPTSYEGLVQEAAKLNQ